MSSYFDALSLGVVGNGTTDDTAAIQTIINNAMAVNGLTFFGACTPKITSALVIATTSTTTGRITIKGAGPYSTVFLPSGAFNAFELQTDAPGVVLEDFGIYWSTTQTSSSAVGISSAGDSANVESYFQHMRRLAIINAYTGIALTGTSLAVIDSCLITTYYQYGITVANTTTATGDAGDSIITNCNIDSSPVSAGGTGSASCVGIYQTSSGGLRVINNKIIGQSIGYFLNFNSGVNTGILVFVGNSVEDQTTHCMQLQRQSGVTTTFIDAIIASNQFTGGAVSTAQYLIVVPADSIGTWLTQMAITGNTIVMKTNSATAIFLDSCDNVAVTGNVISATTGLTGCIGVQGGATNCTVGPNQTENLAGGVYNLSGTGLAIQSRTVTGVQSVNMTATTIIPGVYVGTQSVSLTAGFISAPRVFITLDDTTGTGISAFVIAVSKTSFTIKVLGSSSTGSLNVQWMAFGD